MPPPTHRRSMPGIGCWVPEIRARRHLSWQESLFRGDSSDHLKIFLSLSLSFSLFLSLFLVPCPVSLSLRSFPERPGAYPIPLVPQNLAFVCLFSLCFFPFRPAAKLGFSLPFSLFFSLPLFVSRSVFRVAFPSLFSGKAGSLSNPTLGRQTSSFYLVLHSNVPPPKTVFLDPLSLSFSLFLLCISFRILFFFRIERVRKGRRPIQSPLSPKNLTLVCLFSLCFFPTPGR